MDWLNANDYELARQVLQRGVAAIYLIAFLSTAAQFRALLGEHGLLPVTQLLKYHRRGPTLFRWRYSDRLLMAVTIVGAALAVTVVAGLPQLGPPWLPLIVFLSMYGLYLSIVNVGQTFYSFGWESLLLEAGFLVAFLGSDAVPPPTAILILTGWLVFRLEFGAGMIKMRGDRVWRDLTALYYHHETQPMPNPVSRFAHHLPKPVHKLEVLGNHFAQLVVPWLLFFPQPVRSGAAVIIILTQLWLVISGNFAWLNWLTIVLAFGAVSDSVAHALVPAIPLDWGAATSAPIWWIVIVLAATAFMLVLSYWPARNLVSRRQLMNASFNGWHLVNAYGAFGSITRPRYEVIVEGTDAANPTDAADWREYQFKGKPGDVMRMPRQFAPYHLRLDWLMWFLPLRGGPERWFVAFLVRLLEADRRTLRLLRVDPFHGRPPHAVRARLFVYHFTTRAQKRATGACWVREPVDEFVPALSLDGRR
ncbi:lipase maturation factor family protein [Salinibacterium sp. ZJ454]|uniref:lipase maturation factor family protein n=1 Tax=Salinibacterium sp. ZJ454 TaxID=2708339 RepID=UPI0014208BBC|nr:lipase maturation factor family protein [Salinibacterium sp. ZJ454]